MNATYFYQIAADFLARVRKRWSCTPCRNYLYVEFEGTAHPCELIPDSIGNVRKQGVDAVWNSREAGLWRNRINRWPTCHSCIEPGAVRYSACMEGLSYLRFLAGLGRRRFHERLHGEGPAKYFGT